MTDADEWLSVAQAARRLGIGERHGRRLAQRLAAQDRRESGPGPALVRLSALDQARAFTAPRPSEAAKTVGSEPAVESGPDPGLGPAESGRLADSAAALLAEKDARIADLRAALAQAQDVAGKALEALRREQARTHELEQLQARLIQALPAPTQAEPAQQSEAPAEDVLAPEPQAPDLSAGSAEDGDRPQAGTLTPPELSAGVVGAKAENDVPAAGAENDVPAKRPNVFERWLTWLRQ